jgi:hypothetical protein
MDHLNSIRSKLSTDEISFLKRRLGFDLNNPDLEEQIAAVAELESLSQKIESIQSHAAAGERAQLVNQPQCAFCGRGTMAAGPLAQSRRGVSICRSCAQECISSIEEGRGSDA